MAGNFEDSYRETSRGRNESRRCPRRDRKRNETTKRFEEEDEEEEVEEEKERGGGGCCQDLPEVGRPTCVKDYRSAASGRATTSRGPCPRIDVIGQLKATTDIAGIRRVIEQVASEEITTAAEFIFCLTPFVADKCAIFRQILEKELSFFRDIVNDTVDRRIQDEADVMMHTQNDIKNKFRSLIDAMNQRTMRIRQRLYEISPTFNWALDGRDRNKISKIIIKPLHSTPGKIKSKASASNVIEKLTHQVFMRGQWLKKELTRLQEENDNLEFFLEKFRCLAAERKEEESHVPKMLSREKKQLERELNELRKTHKRNLEIINALYIEHHRCIKPHSDCSIVD